MGFLNLFRSKGKIEKVVTTTETIRETSPVTGAVAYIQDFMAFVKWAAFHRKFQANAIKAIEQNTIGQISLPTGTGKTRVQVHEHIRVMIENQKQGTCGVHVIASHRLALNHQLLNDLLRVVVSCGLPFDILFVGSDQFDMTELVSQFRDKGLTKHLTNATSTTTMKEIEIASIKAQGNKRHLLICSTYQSFTRLSVLSKIDICTYDEAHTLIGNVFLDNVTRVKPIIERNFFFTATRRIIGTDGGMNRTDIFGEVIYEESPRSMIDQSEIVPPKLHIIDTVDEGDYNNHTMVVKAVIEGFNQHKILVKENSVDPDAIGAKLMISTTGTKEMEEIINDESFKAFCVENSIRLFAFGSVFGNQAIMDFEKKERNQVMDVMQNLPDSTDAILIHIDILTEGINLPSITGVMPFRELNQVKLLQTIGRSARLLKVDRENLYGGWIQPKQYDAFIKPYCWILIPRFFKSLGDSESMKSVIKSIINTYEVPVEEYSIVDKYMAVSSEDADRITKFDKPTRKEKESDLRYLVEDILEENVTRGLRDVLGHSLKSLTNLFG